MAETDRPELRQVPPRVMNTQQIQHRCFGGCRRSLVHLRVSYLSKSPTPFLLYYYVPGLGLIIVPSAWCYNLPESATQEHASDVALL